MLGSIFRERTAITARDNILAHPEIDLKPGESQRLARWGTPVAVFGKAMGLAVWPVALCHDYSYAAITTVKRLDEPRLLGGVAWLTGILGAILFLSRASPRLVIPIALMLITYSVVSNVPILTGTIFAERLLYLPSVGICMFAGVTAAYLWERCSVTQRTSVRFVFAAGGCPCPGRTADWLCCSDRHS